MKNNVLDLNFNNDAPVREFYEELMDHAKHDDPGSRLRAASMIMERCGDEEMSDVLRTLSAQMDFDDNEEACDAIERTRAKLDALIADRQKNRSMSYIRVLRDSEILDISNGEVRATDFDDIQSKFYKNGLFDPDIFGGSGKIPFYDDEHDKMPTKSFGAGVGHIQLPVHVVLESSYLSIAGILGISVDDVKKVAKYSAYMVLDPGKSSLKKYKTLSEKEYVEHKADEGLRVGIGGDAIYEALSGLGLNDEPERLAFSVVPVASPVVRPVAYSKEEDSFYDYPLNRAYKKVIYASNRRRKVGELGAPEIILRNESRMLDDAVNSLVEMAHDSILQTHWTKSNLHSFIFGQLNFIMRNRKFYIRRLTKEELNKTDDIESLGLFPETILLDNGKGKTEDISLQEVLDHNNDIVYDYQQEHAIFLPGDAKDEDLNEETKAEISALEKTVSRMENYSNDILASARRQGRDCMVRYDEKEGMYMLAEDCA